MNLSHLRATLWLRWRILVNRVKRTGKLSNTIFVLLMALCLIACVSVFVLGIAVGAEILPDYKPTPFLVIWSLLAGGFLFFWMIGLLTDLQRSDAMSFKNLLHLPVSLSWVFLYNYLSSFVSLSVALFLPAMLGASIAMVIVGGPAMLAVFPLVIGYFLMITALTYQLRGWLARVMEDKRRGRNIIALVTVAFVLLLQVPNLINLKNSSANRETRLQEMTERFELQQAAKTEGPDQAAARERLERWEAERDAREQAEDDALESNLSLGAIVFPPGWLPYGIRAGFERRWLPLGLCTLGLWAIAAASLRRSYRTTMNAAIGAGEASDAGDSGAAPSATEQKQHKRRGFLVQRTIPFVGEGEAGIATATLQSHMRAPECKMLLLSPVILLAVFGMMLANNPNRDMLVQFAPMMSLGAATMALVSIIQLIQNQFGLDRAGFRLFVLSPVPRHEILLGKNLATAPLGLGVGLIALVGLAIFIPTDASHFVGACFQLVSAYLIVCMVGNMISILGPMRLKEHAMKAANAQWKTVLWQVLSLFMVPIALSPLLIPAGAEFFLGDEPWARAIPLFLVLHVAGMLAILLLYRWIVRRQGDLLQSREQHILEILTRE